MIPIKDNTNMAIQAEPSVSAADQPLGDIRTIPEERKGRFAFFKTPRFYLVLLIGLENPHHLRR